jgi:hypothetical protein
MKNSGGEAEGNPDHLLHQLGGNAEVAAISANLSSDRKTVDEIPDTRVAVNHQRLTKAWRGSTVTSARM